GGGAPSRARKVRGYWNRLRVSKIHAGTVQGRRSLERLPRRDQRSIRVSEEDAVSPRSSVPTAVRFLLDLPASSKPLWPARQLRPSRLARHPSPHQEVHLCEGNRR